MEEKHEINLPTLTWEGIIKALLVAVSIFIVSTAFYFTFSHKHIVGYQLGSDNNNRTLVIRVDIENYVDDIIPLQNITYTQAARMVDSLNISLSKTPNRCYDHP